MKWFRMYHSILDSLKVRKLPDSQQLNYMLLLCCASEYRERTGINTGETGLTIEDAVWRTRSATLEGTFPTLIQLDLVRIDSYGKIVLTDWTEKQFKSDDIAARTLIAKQKKRGNVPGNPVGHVRDTDTDTDKKPTTSTPAARKPTSAVTLKTYLTNLKTAGEKFCTDYPLLWERVEKLKLPADYVELAWLCFRDRHLGSSKRYTDWRKTFINCVEGGWFKLWYIDADSNFQLTTAGKQAKRKFEEKAA